MIVILYAMICVLFDWKFYKIPNVLCFFIAVNGIYFSLISYGWSRFGDICLGMMIPMILLYLLFYCGMMGAGDIKELISLGTFFGKEIWKVLVLSFLMNGLIAVVKMRREASFRMRFAYFRGYLRDCRLEGRILDDYKSRKEDRIHFSIGILCAVIYVVLMSD